MRVWVGMVAAGIIAAIPLPLAMWAHVIVAVILGVYVVAPIYESWDRRRQWTRLLRAANEELVRDGFSRG